MIMMNNYDNYDNYYNDDKWKRFYFPKKENKNDVILKHFEYVNDIINKIFSGNKYKNQLIISYLSSLSLHLNIEYETIVDLYVKSLVPL